MSYLLLYNYGCTNALCHQNIYVSLKAFLSSNSICQSRKTRSVRVVRNFYQRHPPPKASICSRGLSTEASSSNHGESSDTHAKSHRRPTQHTRRDTGPYAFPTHANPTPYEIFHLPVGATQNAIKGRYYDLVRLHHPDSPHCRSLNLSPSIARSRFHAITAAYDSLRRGTASTFRQTSASNFRHRPKPNANSGRPHAYEQHARGFSAEWASMGAAAAQEPTGDDRWKDRMIIGVGLAAFAVTLSSIAIIPTSLGVHEVHHRSASQNLAAARREARHVRWGRESKHVDPEGNTQNRLEQIDSK